MLLPREGEAGRACPQPRLHGSRRAGLLHLFSGPSGKARARTQAMADTLESAER
ncbi:MAG: hypothetical protein Q7J69_04040 [Candidatus Omnitrophota bacterium]|nr:hypothetical protein [Candidatus Omnitrophota bacterium]